MLLLLIQLLQERHGDKLNLDRRVSVAKQFIDDNFHKKIVVTELAIVAHLSIRQLNELFRTQIGMTPHHYLTELRMQESWRLLEQSDLNIQRIADAVGYGSLSSFSDRFSRHFGKPPSYFRRKSK
jgi:transcriptional regulator GlxA family with amidase domain